MELKEKNVFRTKNGLYYEVIRVGKLLISAKRLDKNSFLQLTNESLSEIVDTVYNTENEIRIIKNRVREEKLIEKNIDVETFEKMDVSKRNEVLDKKGVDYFDKVDLLDFEKIEIDHKKINATMEEAVKKQTKVLINLNLNNQQMQKEIDILKIVIKTEKEADKINWKNLDSITCTPEIYEYLLKKEKNKTNNINFELTITTEEEANKVNWEKGYIIYCTQKICTYLIKSKIKNAIIVTTKEEIDKINLKQNNITIVCASKMYEYLMMKKSCLQNN